MDVDPGRLFAALRERWGRILVACVCAAVAAFVLASLASPSYRAETRVLIDGEGASAHVELIGSTDILTKAASALNLADYGEFKFQELSVFGRLMVMAGLRTDPGNLAPGDRVLRKLRENLEIHAVTDSMIVVGFSSHEPELAANVPNAIANAYLEVRRQADIGAAAYPQLDARVISRAMTPSEPYFPRILPITAAAFAATLVLMITATLLAELFSGRAVHRASRPVAAIPQVVMPAVPPEQAVTVEQGDSHGEQRYRHVHGRSKPAPEGSARLGIEAAAGKLIAGGADRAVFVAPEGGPGAVTSVLVARMAADSGLRVILVDLTTSGTASVPMLETTAFPGITNLLASEAQFCDVIRGDLYSDCHIIPVGTASGTRAMRAAERLPIIADSLATAYDLVIIECGHATVDALARMVGADSIIVVSALDPGEESAETMLNELAAAGLGEAVLVIPAGNVPPMASRGRDAA